jgi:hypothetical protein
VCGGTVLQLICLLGVCAGLVWIGIQFIFLTCFTSTKVTGLAFILNLLAILVQKYKY